MTTWNSADTPPAQSGTYLVFTPSIYPEERIFIGEYNAVSGDWSIHIDGQRLAPTHWMEKPSAPE